MTGVVSAEGTSWVKVFDLIDKQVRQTEDARHFNETAFLKKAKKATDPKKYPKLKLNLYNELLSLARQFHQGDNSYESIFDLYRKAELLSEQGLYKQAMDLVEKGIKQAHQAQVTDLEVMLYKLRWTLHTRFEFGNIDEQKLHDLAQAKDRYKHELDYYIFYMQLANFENTRKTQLWMFGKKHLRNSAKTH